MLRSDEIKLCFMICDDVMIYFILTIRSLQVRCVLKIVFLLLFYYLIILCEQHSDATINHILSSYICCHHNLFDSLELVLIVFGLLPDNYNTPIFVLLTRKVLFSDIYVFSFEMRVRIQMHSKYKNK